MAAATLPVVRRTGSVVLRLLVQSSEPSAPTSTAMLSACWPLPPSARSSVAALSG
jgi:hypothetical protein